MAQIRGDTQIIAGTITNAEISGSAAIATSKLADGVEFIQRDGSVAMTGDLVMGSQSITGLLDGVNAQDAVTKTQLDSVAAGLDLKEAVRVATDAALPAVTASGTKVGKTLLADSVGVVTIDGEDLTAVNNFIVGDRLLVKNQVAGIDNGLYTISILSAAGVALELTRAVDADGSPASEVTKGMFVFVGEGTANANSGWSLLDDADYVSGVCDVDVATNEQAFTQFQGIEATTASLGVQKVGNDMRADLLAAGGLNLSGNSVQVKVDTVEAGLQIATSTDGVALADMGLAAHILVADAGLRPVSVAMSGDIVISNSGATSFNGSPIVNADINAGAAIARSKIVDGTDMMSYQGDYDVAAGDGGGANTFPSARTAVVGDFYTVSVAGTAATAAVTLRVGDMIVANVASAADNAAHWEIVRNYEINTDTTLASTSDIEVGSTLALKTYIDNATGAISGKLTFKSASYDGTATPDAETSSAVLTGDYYVVSVQGSGAGTLLRVGDVLIANVDNAGTVTLADFDVIRNYELNVSATLASADDITVASSLAVKTYIDNEISTNESGKWQKIGTFDASGGTLPGAGAAVIGDVYENTVAGTIDSIEMLVGDMIVANTDNASTTLMSNWDLIQNAVDTSALTAGVSDSTQVAPSRDAVQALVAGNAVGFVDGEVPTGDLDGVDVTYILAGTPDPISSVYVYLNGLRLKETTDFAVSGTTITFVSAPQSGDVVTADYRI